MFQLQRGFDNRTHLSEYGSIRPRVLGDKVMQRLVLGLHVQGINMRRQWFNTLAFDRQHQAAAVILQPHSPTHMAQHARQSFKITLQFFVNSHGRISSN